MDINHLRHPSAILKMIEIMLLIVVMALFFSQLSHWAFFVATVIVGCFLNAIVLLANIVMGYDQHQKTPLELILYAYNVIGFFASGIALFTSDNGPWIVAGIFCLILMGVYGTDWYFSFVNFRGHPPPFLAGGGSGGATQPSNTQGDQVDAIIGGVAFINQSPAGLGERDLGEPSQVRTFDTNPVYPESMKYPPSMFPDSPPPKYSPNTSYEPKV